jgi:hypothetical protein
MQFFCLYTLEHMSVLIRQVICALVHLQEQWMDVPAFRETAYGAVIK